MNNYSNEQKAEELLGLRKGISFVRRLRGGLWEDPGSRVYLEVPDGGEGSSGE